MFEDNTIHVASLTKTLALGLCDCDSREPSECSLLFESHTHSNTARPRAFITRFTDRYAAKCTRRLQPTKRSRLQRLRLPNPIPHGRVCTVRLAIATLSACLLTIILVAAVFFPSYSREPPHYREIRQRAALSNRPARANPNNERVFIAASLFDPRGDIASGPWGQALVDLVDLLGPANVFVSIYESDSGWPGKKSLDVLEARLQCNHHFAVQSTIDMDLNTAAKVRLQDGTLAFKRIDYLAEARNRALLPLRLSAKRYHKILFLNDAYYDPIEAVQLLFATNTRNGVASYRSACAADFGNPFKYYDTFATRDQDGYSLGVPIYPWFAASGSGQSRDDVLRQSDAVRVKSCWGSMVAFDARFFQPASNSSAGGVDRSAVRFRGGDDLDWEYSECCLIHADIAAVNRTEPQDDVGIYLNPYIRTAYSKTTFRWLWLARRSERLLSPIQSAINSVVRLPYLNERRYIAAGQEMEKLVWEPNASIPELRGVWKNKTVLARPGEFCSIKRLLVRRIKPDNRLKNWDYVSLSIDLTLQTRVQ